MRAKAGKLKISIYVVLNCLFSLIIILLNKWIYDKIHFPNVTLSMLHFFTTFIGLYICEKLNVFNVKSIEVKHIIVLALSFCGFVVFTNLSLQNNSVGTFQVAKVLNTPGVVLIQYFYYLKKFSTPIKLTLVPIIIGVILNFYYDIHFNILGTIYAVLAVIITSTYQVLVSQKQSELQMSSMQLLYYQAPLSTIFLIFCIPFVEPPLQTLSYGWTSKDMILVAVSCSVAFFTNLTTYWIIGNTSALTYNMLGHAKFILITLLGWYMFSTNMGVYQWFGITLTLTGIVLYSHIKMKENNRVQYQSLQEIKT